MLIFRYSKLNGAEYISHLDTLRHIGKTLVRAKIDVAFSQGFNPHIQIFMSPPVFVGLKTLSEYCLVETNTPPNSFMQKFNEFSPKGIKCLTAFSVNRRYKIAGEINSAEYVFDNVQLFDVNEILNKNEIIVETKGEKKNIREKIIDLKIIDNRLIAQLSFGNSTLRADVFANYLKENFQINIQPTKANAFIDGLKPENKYDCNY